MQTPPRLRPGENYLVNWMSLRNANTNLYNMALTVDHQGNTVYVNVYTDGYEYEIDPNIMGLDGHFYFTLEDISNNAGIVATLNRFRQFIGLGNVSLQDIYTPPY